MKKFLCILMAFVMLFGFAACGKKIVVNKKPHIEAGDIVYDESEIKVEEEFYTHCGSEYEIMDLIEYIIEMYSADMVWNIVYEEEFKDRADSLAASLKELEFDYTLNGEEPAEETADNTIPEVITE